MTENSKNDIRFSKLLSTVDKGKVLPDKEFLSGLRDITLEEFETYSTGSEDNKQTITISNWRKIMNSKITKLAAAAVVIITAVIGISQLGGSVDGSSVAFGEVLRYFQKHNYSFDLAVETLIEDQDSTGFKIQAMVSESGKVRFDWQGGNLGKMTSITNFNTGESMLLFHKNKSAVKKQEPVLNKSTGASGIVSFFTKPVENLWNLRDGSEEDLGEKEIDGRKVTGFRVLQEDQYFEYDLTIWASIKEGFPYLVEAIAKEVDKSYPSIKWTMRDFEIDVEFDEKLFSLELPEGYTLAYQEDLENIETVSEPSEESEKIVKMLEIWSQGKEDEAIECLLSVDWIKQITFGKEPYIFSLTEKGFISLKAEDQKQVAKEIMATGAKIRKIVKKSLGEGKTALMNQDYKSAEKHFNAAFELGELLNRDDESMIITRLVGIAVQRIALKEMINLYEETKNEEKLQFSQKQLRQAEAEGDQIKKEATGR